MFDTFPSDPDDIYVAFMEAVEKKGLTPYPAQEEAILEILSGHNVILNTPTGSGKSLVAAAMHFASLCQGRISYYTCPIKALVNEKFLSLCRDFGAKNVGMITGDASVNPTAPIICCTAEILSNLALRDGRETPVDDVIMDEFHFYSDRERGVAWQVPLLTLPHARFLLMSATLGGDTTFFARELEKQTGATTTIVSSSDRPVPLQFEWEEETLQEVYEKYRGSPVYIVHFSQREATETAAAFLSVPIATKEQRQQIDAELVGERFRSPFGKQMKKLLRHGIGLHHAGLLPKYRVLAEKLVQKGLINLICGTDTLGVGINVPISTVVFTKLAKYDGEKQRVLTVRDFQQIAGRAGRRGYDTLGKVVAVPPPHVLENLKAKRKAADKGKKKPVLKKAPEGFVGWDEKTFRRLIDSEPEALRSSFTVTHGMLLNVLGRPHEDGIQAMRDLIADCHDSAVKKRRHRRRAFQLFRSMVDKDVLDLYPPDPELDGDAIARVEVNIELQEDFSLNHALSLFLVHAVPLLDKDHPDYALDLLALVECILEDPHAVIRGQIRKAKDIAVTRMKAEGVSYEDRMDELEKIEHPKPNGEWIYETFNAFRDTVPWIGGAEGDNETVRPKAIVHEMLRLHLAFPDYVKRYGLQRSEGVLLRHLSQTYKVMLQTVPEDAKTPEFHDMEILVESMIQETDSSLLDEWATLAHPDYDPNAAQDAREQLAADAAAARGPSDITRDEHAFTVLVRNASTRLVRLLATGQWDDATEFLHPESATIPLSEKWTPQKLKTLLAPFHERYQRIDLGPDALSRGAFKVIPGKSAWTVEQTLYATAPEEDLPSATEFLLRTTFDLENCRAENGAAPTLNALEDLSAT